MELPSPIDRALRIRPPIAGRRRRLRLGSLATASAVRTGAPIATGRDRNAGDAKGERRAVSRGAWLACAAGGLLAALLLVQLRTESIDLRYRLARSLQTEQRLLEEQRRLIVELRQQRHPVRLAQLGASLGLARPEALRELAPRSPAP
jgi:hypothetical protein